MSSPSPPLSAGMFLMPVHDPKKPLAQCYDEDIELVLNCEEFGLKEFWCGEHHSSVVENIVMPEIFIAKALGMTKNIRMGASPVCLQYHHPVHVASRLAFLDHLSHGRLNVCFGLGAVPTDLEVYGVDPQKSGHMVSESMEAILQIWSSDPPYQFDGKFWNFKLKDAIDPDLSIGTLHKPLQRPFPPISVPCVNRGSYSIKLAGTRGFRPISHHMAHTKTLKNHWETYAAAAEEAGRTPDPSVWSVSRNILVTESNDEARQLAHDNSLGRCIEYILEMTRRGPGVDMWKRDENQSDTDCNLDYFVDDVIIAGDPPTVTEKILQLREEVGDFGTLVLVAHDWDDKVRWQKSLELFAKEVLPAVNRQIAV